MTVKELINRIIKKTGLGVFASGYTCDVLVAGDEDQEVVKVVTTFMATVDVIQEAVKLGANFIITHEPTWFTGMDQTDWIMKDPVYLEKKRLIEENHIAIWRFHDYMHMGDVDGIYRGFEQEFGWKDYRMPDMEGSELNSFGACYLIPETTLRNLSCYFKDALDMDVIQIVGNPEMTVRRVGVLVGGGSLGLGLEQRPMMLMAERNLDVVICGDITEWTLSAYVRDAASLGMNKGMLVLGHERSEECGMKHLPEWIKPIDDELEIIFIDAGEPFVYL